jgi:trigger factor
MTDNNTLQTISSDLIEAEIERLPNCIVEFRVKVKAPLIATAEKEAAKQISKEASIPGFRKGKAPTTIIKTKFPEALKQEVEKTVANHAFRACQKELFIPLLNQDSKVTYKAKEFSETSAEISFKFETEPKVPEFTIENLQITPLQTPVVTDADIEETVRRIQLFYATWENIEDRTAEVNDYVLVDIEDLDTDPPTKPFNNSRFEISDKSMAEWMKELIIGSKIGESKEGKSHPDQNESDEVKKEYKEKKVRITVNKIEKPNLPPFDDELAKKVGVSTKEEMLVRLKQLMEKQSFQKTQEENRDLLANALLEAVQFDIPSSVLDNETSYRLKQQLQDPIFQKRWNLMPKEDQEKKREDLKKDADRAIRMFYICKKVAQENKLSIMKEDLYPKIETTLDAMFADSSTLNAYQRSKEDEALMFSKQMLSRAQDFMIDRIVKSSV